MKNTKSTIIRRIKMLESGVIPALSGRELSAMLASMDSEESRVAKRKFRKKWRKLIKAHPNLKPYLYPHPSEEPSEKIKNYRKNYTLLKEYFDEIY